MTRRRNTVIAAFSVFNFTNRKKRCILSTRSCQCSTGPIAQLVRAPPCHGGGHRFKSDSGRGEQSFHGCLIGSVAQLVERTTENREVNGSIPFGATALSHHPERGDEIFVIRTFLGRLEPHLPVPVDSVSSLSSPPPPRSSGPTRTTTADPAHLALDPLLVLYHRPKVRCTEDSLHSRANVPQIPEARGTRIPLRTLPRATIGETPPPPGTVST